MDRRRMCPHCRAFITTDDKVCPYCDTAVAPRSTVGAEMSGVVENLLSGSRFVTTVILVINIGLFAAAMLYSSQTGIPYGQTLVLFGAKYSPLVFAGEYWRLVTAGFLHGGLMHIMMNSWAMTDVGMRVEEFFGTSRMVVIYFAGTVCGFLASSYWSASVSVGASAGLFGLIGAMIAFGTMNRTLYGEMIKSHYLRWAAYGLVLGLVGNIDNAAHLGGLAGGFGVARVSGDETAGSRRVWDVLCYLCLALTALSFGKAVLFFLAVQASRTIHSL